MANKTLSYDSVADELMNKASRSRAKKRANAILKRMALDGLRKDFHPRKRGVPAPSRKSASIAVPTLHPS